MKKYTQFTSLSIKARMGELQKRLIDLGYDLSITFKRDKPTVKSLMDFQKKNGIVPNGVVCENTYNKLFLRR